MPGLVEFPTWGYFELTGKRASVYVNRRVVQKLGVALESVLRIATCRQRWGSRGDSQRRWSIEGFQLEPCRSFLRLLNLATSTTLLQILLPRMPSCWASPRKLATNRSDGRTNLKSYFCRSH